MDTLNIYNLTDIEYKPKEYVFDEDLQKVKIVIQNVDELKLIENRTKIAACLVIVRNSLTRGNKEVTAALEETVHPKDKTWDKLRAIMLDTCHGRITMEDCDNVIIFNLDPKT